MHDENNNNNNRPPFPNQGFSRARPSSKNEDTQPSIQVPQGLPSTPGVQSFEPYIPPPAAHSPTLNAPPSGEFMGEFSSSHSGFQSNASGFQTQPQKSVVVFELTPKVRMVYGASAFFGAAIVGLFLGFLNSALQGVDMLAELGTVIEIALWFATFVGFLGALKPQEFERIFENLRRKIEG